MSDTSVFHENNTQYRCKLLLAQNAFKVVAATPIGSKLHVIEKIVPAYLANGDISQALEIGVRQLRPKIQMMEARERGEDVAVPKNDAIDLAIERERKVKQQREEMEQEARDIREAAGRMLDEQNPLWGMFG